MKRLWLVGLLALTMIPRAHAQSFDTADKVLLVGSSLAIFGDWSTTMNGIQGPGREANPITRAFVGEQPSRSALNKYFGASLLANVVIARCLPSKLRKIWLGGGFVLRLSAIEGNLAQGLQFTLKF